MVTNRFNKFPSYQVLFNWTTLVDLVTAVPFIIALGIPNGQFVFIPNFLRAFFVVRRLRLLLNLNVACRLYNGFLCSWQSSWRYRRVDGTIGFVDSKLRCFYLCWYECISVCWNGLQRYTLRSHWILVLYFDYILNGKCDFMKKISVLIILIKITLISYTVYEFNFTKKLFVLEILVCFINVLHCLWIHYARKFSLFSWKECLLQYFYYDFFNWNVNE